MATVTTEDFQRARTEEQRAQRREHILRVTREMLAGQRLSNVSFNDIARQVGLAKSNIMRYFESREAIFLTLLQEEYAEWVDEVAQSLANSDDSDPLERVATVLAQTSLRRPLLCELLTHVMTVLEHNVTTEEVMTFKLGVQASMARLVCALTPHVGDWNDKQQGLFLSEMHACITHTWALAHPSAALQAAYETNTAIRPPRSAPSEVVQATLATLLVGLKYRRLS